MIIPECKELYCPWEVFREIVLSRICLDCVEEPLRSSLLDMMPDAGASVLRNTGDLWHSHAVISLMVVIFLASLMVVAVLVGKGLKSRRKTIDYVESQSLYVE